MSNQWKHFNASDIMNIFRDGRKKSRSMELLCLSFKQLYIVTYTLAEKMGTRRSR